jgi:hypothetical protein
LQAVRIPITISAHQLFLLSQNVAGQCLETQLLDEVHVGKRG